MSPPAANAVAQVLYQANAIMKKWIMAYIISTQGAAQYHLLIYAEYVKGME